MSDPVRCPWCGHEMAIGREEHGGWCWSMHCANPECEAEGPFVKPASAEHERTDEFRDQVLAKTRRMMP